MIIKRNKSKSLCFCQDKLAKLPPSPEIQPHRVEMATVIKRRFRKVERDSLIPTFEEFAEYVVAFAFIKC